MKTKDLKLSSLSKVRGIGETVCEGRLGLLLFDRDAQYTIAITAAQIVDFSGELKLNDVIVAQRSVDTYPAIDYAGPQAASSMLAEIVMRADIDLEESQPSVFPAEAAWASADPDDVLGERVLIHTTSSPRTAYLRSTSGSFRMPSPITHTPTLFCDALELTTVDGRPVTVQGDAGALVTTKGGQPLGIIVCGFETFSFAAPLKSRLDELKSVTWLTAERVQEHNRLAEAMRTLPERIVLSKPQNKKSNLLELHRATEERNLDILRVEIRLANDEFLRPSATVAA